MAQVFISYAREDEAFARQLVDRLAGGSIDVWWDRYSKKSSPFDKAIEQALADAKAAVVIWSPHSIDSDWVRAEAAKARERKILVQVLASGVVPADVPVPFNNYDAVRVVNDRGLANGAWFTELATAIQDLGVVARPANTLPQPSMVSTGTGQAPAGPQRADRGEPANPPPHPAPSNDAPPRRQARISLPRWLVGAGVLGAVAALVIAVLAWPSSPQRTGATTATPGKSTNTATETTPESDSTVPAATSTAEAQLDRSPDCSAALRVGCRGDLVRQLQQLLASVGLYDADNVDGVFGDVTKDALAEFQRAHHFETDGVIEVALDEWNALVSASQSATTTSSATSEPAVSTTVPAGDIEVPNLGRLTEPQARQVLLAAGLKMAVEHEAVPLPSLVGKVIGQEPKPKSTARRGDVVTVTIGQGITPVTGVFTT